jgi:hypothetical protein
MGVRGDGKIDLQKLLIAAICRSALPCFISGEDRLSEARAKKEKGRRKRKERIERKKEVRRKECSTLSSEFRRTCLIYYRETCEGSIPACLPACQ